MSRIKWEQISSDESFRGRWVAMDDCRFEQVSGRPLEGHVVDADVDLVELCNRMRERDQKHCTIVFCGETEHRILKSQLPPSLSDPFRHAAH